MPRRASVKPEEGSAPPRSKAGFILSIILFSTSLFIGVAMMGVAVVVWVRENRFGVPGFVVLILGFLLVGLTIWGKVKVKVGKIEIALEHNKEAILKLLLTIPVGLLSFLYFPAALSEYKVVVHHAASLDLPTEIKRHHERESHEQEQSKATIVFDFNANDNGIWFENHEQGSTRVINRFRRGGIYLRPKTIAEIGSYISKEGHDIQAIHIIVRGDVSEANYSWASALELAAKRAEITRDFLVSKGLSEGLITLETHVEAGRLTEVKGGTLTITFEHPSENREMTSARPRP